MDGNLLNINFELSEVVLSRVMAVKVRSEDDRNNAIAVYPHFWILFLLLGFWVSLVVSTLHTLR